MKEGERGGGGGGESYTTSKNGPQNYKPNFSISLIFRESTQMMAEYRCHFTVPNNENPFFATLMQSFHDQALEKLKKNVKYLGVGGWWSRVCVCVCVCRFKSSPEANPLSSLNPFFIRHAFKYYNSSKQLFCHRSIGQLHETTSQGPRVFIFCPPPLPSPPLHSFPPSKVA